MPAPRPTPRRPAGTWRRVDVILPTQFHAEICALADPERRLRLAVLEDAVHQFQRYVNPTGRHERALHDDVLDWFASEDRSEPFSFESICDALHIDTDFVRSGSRRWRDGARVRVPRSRPRVMSGGTVFKEPRAAEAAWAGGVRSGAARMKFDRLACQPPCICNDGEAARQHCDRRGQRSEATSGGERDGDRVVRESPRDVLPRHSTRASRVRH
jgi:hypothetical protein